jgi:hypothetical protein
MEQGQGLGYMRGVEEVRSNFTLGPYIKIQPIKIILKMSFIVYS